MRTTEEQPNEITENALILWRACEEALITLRVLQPNGSALIRELEQAMAKTK